MTTEQSATLADSVRPHTTALVLYHENCPDGFTAAWAVWKSLGDTAEYRAVNYGQPPPEDVAGRRVILVDFSYPRATLDAIAAHALRVEVYDHHRTAEADLKDWNGGRVVFDMARSGAGIAWDQFGAREHWASGDGARRPKLVDYVEDRDLWRWALPESREISEYLFSQPRDFKTWDYLAEHLERREGFRDAVAIGIALLRAKRIRIQKVCENTRWITLAGHPHLIPVVNTSWDFSDIGEFLCERHAGAHCAGYYFDRADRRQWGFRSRGDFDVSVLCKRYGGGGHKSAAGFTSDLDWWPA